MDVQKESTSTTPAPLQEATTEQEGEAETKEGFQPAAIQNQGPPS
jgi:hypothetical protein